MTLIFAGFETVKKAQLSFRKINIDDDFNVVEDLPVVQDPEDVQLEISGIYFAADSAITSGGKTLLNDFRKIYPVRVGLWRPYFAGGIFRGYAEEFLKFDVAIAFAGSTLSAQHYLNVITKHLANLRISYKKGCASIKYTVLLDCQENPLESGGYAKFEDDTFLYTHFKGILTAEYISTVVLHSIKKGVSSARQYKLSEDEFKSLFVEMALGVECPSTKKHHLYKYTMKSFVNNGLNDVDVVVEEVGCNEVIVLGMSEKYKDDATDMHNNIKKSGVSAAMGMFDYLNNIIEELNRDGDKRIAKPSILKIYKSGKLDIAKHQK